MLTSTPDQLFSNRTPDYNRSYVSTVSVIKSHTLVKAPFNGGKVPVIADNIQMSYSYVKSYFNNPEFKSTCFEMDRDKLLKIRMVRDTAEGIKSLTRTYLFRDNKWKLLNKDTETQLKNRL